MPSCPECGGENPDGARFCSFCGVVLSAPVPGRRKLATLLFCDVSGSTALAERFDVEAVEAMLRSYFEEMRATLARHGGTVAKFIGDAVVAAFGVPQAHEDDALRACRAALEMQARMIVVNEEFERRFGTQIAVRIGVNSGEVMAGDPSTTFVTGDAANVAARLEQAAAPGEVLIGEPTYRLVRDAVTVEAVGPVTAKGKAAPLTAYRLLALSGHEPLRRRLETPLVGRDEELATLERTLAHAVEGRLPQLVTIVGPPGIGKSRLARALLERADAQVLVGGCLSYGDGITYWPLAEIVAQIGELRSALGDDDLAASRIASALGTAEVPSSPDEIAWGFRRLFEALARERPLIVVFDDIHWAEPALLDLIGYIAAFAADVPLLLLCMARRDLLELRPAWAAPKPNATLLALEPLAGEEAERLVDRLGNLTAGTKAQIVATAAGNPLFVEQLMAMHAESGNGELEIPPTIRALLAARIDRLELAERAVLECAAIEGQVFHRSAVAALSSEQGASEVGVSLMTLVDKGLIRPDRAMLSGDDGFRFDHILIRDAAYDSIPKLLRADLHERFAGWLEAKLGDEAPEGIVGSHLEQAYHYRRELGPLDGAARMLGERAARHFVQAGRRAIHRGDLHAASNLLERALTLGVADLHERARIQGELGYALFESGRRPESDSVLQSSIEIANTLGDRALATRALVELLQHRLTSDRTFDPEVVQPVAEEAIEMLAELGDSSGLANAERLLGLSFRRRGQGSAAVAALERALGHAEAARDRVTRRRVIGSLAMALCAGPTPADEATRRCEELRESSRDDRVLEAELTRNLALLYAMAGRFDEAHMCLERSSRVLDELNQTTQSFFRMHAAEAKELAGDRAGVEQELTMRRNQLRLPEGGHTGDASDALAMFYCDEDRWDEAADLLAGGHDPNQQGDSVRFLSLTRLVVRARLAAHRGDHAEAVTLIERAVAAAEETDHLNLRGRYQLVLAEVLRAAGRMEEADAAVSRALALYEQKVNIAAATRVRANALRA